jgi:hypothetical protein
LIGPSQKKVETIEATQNGIFHAKMECFSLWPTYMGEKARTLGKTCVIKASAIGNTHGEHIGNLMKLIENLKGTKEKPKKNPPPLAHAPPPPPQT